MRKLYLEKNDFGMAHINGQRRRLQRLTCDRACTVFQFSETLPGTERRKTFVYQGLQADYVRYMREKSRVSFP